MSTALFIWICVGTAPTPIWVEYSEQVGAQKSVQKIPTEFTRQLSELGLKVVPSRGEQDRLSAARKHKARIVLSLNVGIRFPDEKTVRASTELSAIDVRTGKRFSSLRLNHLATGSERAATRAQFDAEWRKSTLEALREKVLPEWVVLKSAGTPYRLILNQATQRQRRIFGRALERIPRVQSVRTLAVSETRLSLEVRFRGGGEALIQSIFKKMRRMKKLRGLARVGRTTDPIELEFVH